MVVIDQYSRRIIGFAVNAGDCDGVSYCRMFNEIISEKLLPKYLSSGNDPLFEFHRWKAKLRIIEVEEIKSVPGVPTSHPFVERVIGSGRREYLNHMLFFNEHDLQKKLDHFKEYYSETRSHSSLEMKTPTAMASDTNSEKTVVSLDRYRWNSHCKELCQLPIAA